MDWFARTFERHFPDDLSLLHAYPTAEGGIQAEWSPEPHEVTLEIDLQTHRGEWHALDMRTAEAEARPLGVYNPSEWAWLVDDVSRSAGGAA